MAVTKASVKKRMVSLGVYKPEFDPAIEQYVRMKNEYQELYTRYKDAGFPFEVETAQGTKKAPIVGVLESLRKDILTAENALGLTPAGLLKLQENAFKKQKNPKRDSLV